MSNQNMIADKNIDQVSKTEVLSGPEIQETCLEMGMRLPYYGHNGGDTRLIGLQDNDITNIIGSGNNR